MRILDFQLPDASLLPIASAKSKAKSNSRRQTRNDCLGIEEREERSTGEFRTYFLTMGMCLATICGNQLEKTVGLSRDK